MANESLRTEREGAVVTVTIDIPPHNIVGADLIVGLLGLLPELESDDSVSVVVFRSADPDFFLMHGDVEALLASAPADEPVTEPNIAAVLFERLHSAPFLTIGVVDGYARGGGCEFLSALDLRIGTARAVIGQPEVAMGILPGAGGTVRMARALGRAKALELILSGRDVSADELLAMGWLQQLVPTSGLDAALSAYVKQFASLDRRSVRAVKLVIDAAINEDAAALTLETMEMNAAMLAGAHVQPMQRFLAAGGQTRDVEIGSIDALLDVMRQTD
ncbi:MAG: enoyl-CoA hydratase/isomerase family protein [Actinomycetota bacterium]